MSHNCWCLHNQAQPPALLPMCQSGREMYEGKNIHYSPVDNKPLCSFSRKLCNQRRLNGYGFCVRHILEDPTAPFRRCAYVAKSSQQMCTQAIPYGEQRQYCNNHMQVLGMLPRRERKPKKEKDKGKDKVKDISKDEKDMAPVPEINKMTFGDRLKSKKLSLPKSSAASILGKVSSPVEDPDDPYAFHDAAPEMDTVQTGVSSSGQTNTISGVSVVTTEVQVRSPHTQPLPSPVQCRPQGEGMGSLSKAKLYPELAEKLEKVRPSPEAKTPKSRARSSRTINKLQTKIAQNKIKDKLRKSQESSQAEMSPSQMAASPDRSGLGSAGLLTSAVPGSEFGNVPTGVNAPGLPCAHLHPFALPGMGLPPFEGSSSGGRSVGVSHLAGPASLYGGERLNHSTLTSQLLSPLHSLPPPYPGLLTSRESSITSTPESAVAHRMGACVMPPVTTTVPADIPPHPLFSSTQASSMTAPSVTMAQPHPHLHSPQPHPHHHPLVRQASLPNQVLRPGMSQPSAKTVDALYPPHASVMNQHLHRAPSGSVIAFPQTSAILASKVGAMPHVTSVLSQSSVNVVGSELGLPPPPPYVPRFVVTSAVSTSLPNMGSVLLTRLQRLRGLLSEKDARMRLKSDLAVKVYAMHAHRKINNHVFVESSMSLCASDEDVSCDEEPDVDMLPWQPDWRGISDDEEETSELDADGELPSDLRTAKLGLLRARLRRQCTQTKHATRINTSTLRGSNKFTMALIKLAKENSFSAAQTLSTILHKPLRWPDERPRRFRKDVWKKTCLYKDAADKQCANMCLPYANHCRKHIMYNVDQQMFEFCTAKNTDNTQCCMPVIDLRHDIPLCFPHAAQAELAKKEEAAEVKKRPRKKTKPPALTRPPRKGKKKKGKNARPQKPMPPDKPTGDISMPETVPLPMDIMPPEPTPSVPPADSAPTITQPPNILPSAAPVAASGSRPSAAGSTGRVSKGSRGLELGSVDLEETLGSEFDKQFELPLEQASRLLEEQDFQEVFNKIPDDAFTDIFSMADKNGEREEVLEEENKQLEQALKSANITLQGLIKGTVRMEDLNEEATVQVAEMLADMQGLQVESDITATAAALDLFNGPAGSHGLPNLSLPLAPLSTHPTQGLLQQVSAAEFSQAVPQLSTSASYLSSVATTSINGVSLPLPQGLVAQNSSTFPQQSVLSALPAGYTTSTSVAQQAGASVVTPMYTAHGYQVVTAGTGQVMAQGQGVGGQTPVGQLHSIAGFPAGLQSLHGLSPALLLNSADLAQSQALLAARGISPSQLQQVRASGHQVAQRLETVAAVTSSPTSLSSQLIARSSQLDGSGSNLHPQHTRASQLQVQSHSSIEAQLAGDASHTSWVTAATSLQSQQQHQQAGTTYHGVNGFPITSQLQYIHGTATMSHSLQTTSVPTLPKFSSLMAQAGSGLANQQVTQTLVTGNLTPGLATITGLKHDLHLISGAAHPSSSVDGQLVSSPIGGTVSPCVVTGLKTDPRLAALSHMAVGRSGSPGAHSYGSAHSPSPTPQPVNQTLPPFSTALPVYQSSGSSS